MGEARKDVLRLDFDSRLKLEFHGTKVTSDGGWVAARRGSRLQGDIAMANLRGLRRLPMPGTATNGS